MVDASAGEVRASSRMTLHTSRRKVGWTDTGLGIPGRSHIVIAMAASTIRDSTIAKRAGQAVKTATVICHHADRQTVHLIQLH